MGSEERERQIADRDRFNQQCFLMDNWKMLAFRNQHDLRVYKKGGYRNFVTMIGPPGEVLHQLVGKRGVEELLNIKPVQLALLVPHIKIYKVDYLTEKSKGKDKQLIFNDHTTKLAVENILTGRAGRGEDVGLKSFTYKFAGRNPAEGGTAEAQLKIFFQNVSAMLREPYDPKTQASFKSLILPEGPWKKESPGDPVHRVWNNKHFRIKIVAGWADPHDPTNALIGTSLRKAIEKSRTVLFMSLKTHELDFEEDGSLTLTVNYQGAIEAALDSESSNIFWSTKDKKEAERLRKENIRTSRKRPSADGQIRPKAPEQTDHNSVEHGKAETAEEKAIEARRKRAIELEALDKQVIWSRVIDGLMTSSRLYSIDVSEEILRGFTSKQDKLLKEHVDRFSPSELSLLRKALAQRNRRLLKHKKGLTKTEIVRSTEKRGGTTFVSRFRYPKTAVERGDIPVLSRSREVIKKSSDVEQGFLYWKKTQPNTEDVHEAIAKNAREHDKSFRVKGDKLRVHFFFLGDLFDIVLEHLFDSTRDDTFNMNILFGSIAIFDPRNPDQKDPFFVNLADIPISLDLFVTWFMETVVKQQRTKYLLKSFIKDVIEKLVIPALGEGCFIGAEKFSSSVTMTTFSVPGVTTRDFKKRLGTQITTKMLSESNLTKNLKDEAATHKPTSQLNNFLYVYVSNYPMKGLSGKRSDDHKRGIYHLTVGSDRGLVKKIKFKKQDQPYVAEERATSDSVDNKRLRDRYNATITMAGNTLFRPGMYVYIDTQSMSNEFGSPLKENNPAFELGLGGYFQVKEINHITDRDTYDTELECQWVHAGRKTKQSPQLKKMYSVLKKFDELQNSVDKR